MADETLDAPAEPQSPLVAQDARFSAIYSLFDSRVVLVGILSIAAWLRFALLAHNSLTFDEMYLLRIALSGWQDIPAILKSAEFHPPLFYLLTKAWLSIAPDLSDGTIRVLPAFLSLVSVALTYIVMRRVSSESVALLSAFLVAVSPFSIMAGQELRMYPLVTVLFLASTYAIMEGVNRCGWAWWVAYVFLAAALLYTHYLSLFLLIGQGAWVAWYDRQHFRVWILAVLAVAILYAPWVPSLLLQGTHSGEGFIGEGSLFQLLSQILGLFAFGGALFGMPDYNYFNTSLKPILQITVLLPFVVVLWFGLRALTAQRCFALAALPSALVIGIPLLLTLGRANFAARWYSFLVPVYALGIAQGIYEIAQRVRSQQRAVVACLTVGLLAYVSAVLALYYFDPNFALYHWRDRAAQIKPRVQPGDFFVYGIRLDAAAFTYYFGSSYPGMVLFPDPDFERMRRLAAQHPRVWLVIAPPATDTMLRQAVDELQKTFQYVTQAPSSNGKPMFPMVYLFRAKTLTSK